MMVNDLRAVVYEVRRGEWYEDMLPADGEMEYVAKRNLIRLQVLFPPTKSGTIKCNGTIKCTSLSE